MVVPSSINISSIVLIRVKLAIVGILRIVISIIRIHPGVTVPVRLIGIPGVISR